MNVNHFTKSYSDSWDLLIEISGNKSAVAVFAFFAKYMDAFSGAVHVKRKALASELGITERSLRDALKLLTEKSVIKEVDNSVFALNPTIVWKGGSYRDSSFRLGKVESGKRIKYFANPAAAPENSFDVNSRYEAVEVDYA